MKEIEFKRICPKCGREIFHKNLKSLKIALYENRQCKQCKYDSQKRKEPYERNCIKCGEKIIYKYPSGYFSGLKNNTKCNKCARKGNHFKRLNKSKFKRNCPICGEIIYYSRNDALKRATDASTKCYKCCDIEHRKCLSEGLLKLNVYPRYNIKACNLFKKINKEMKWSGQFATNGREFYIKDLGYWVDYYEPKLNVVIEYYEPHHKYTRYIKRDLKRKKEIIKNMKCIFIEINEEDKNNWKKIVLDSITGII